MADYKNVKRLVVLVDGCELRGAEKINQSSIERLTNVVREGVSPENHHITQTTKFYIAAGNTSKFADKFKNANPAPELIKSIVRDVCSALEKPEDELWLYGSGHGAFVARAVAGVVHHMGLPTSRDLDHFDELFDSTCAFMKAQAEDDTKNGPLLADAIKEHAGKPPRIPFVGLFDTVAVPTPKTNYDTEFVDSIEAVRHAMAMNENRSAKSLEAFAAPDYALEPNRSLIQAWFLGTNGDMCGGVANDGLSLYPLQWIMLESMKAGLDLFAADKSKSNTLHLVFPQYAGDLPNVDASEDIEWRVNYLNGLQISMFDMQNTHAVRVGTGKNTHTLKLETERFMWNSSRKVFGTASNELTGWTDKASCCTIIHPSLFCILDRNPRFLGLAALKPLKKGIANFQSSCLVDEEDSIAPWLEGTQLQASGVKAFRILVCGKTGVGKSTLINKVFGVEMTEESKTYDQGVHDINVAFESPRHPGLLIHDSRGWQAGSDTELDLIAKFLRHRAFLDDPAEALHVIWFCVDADVSRIEEADKRTFATIAQFSNLVPVFVVGTKKDKVTGYRKAQYLEELMEKMDDYQEAKKIAEQKANEQAMIQFDDLRNQLSQIEHYKADGYCCLSKNDNEGVKDLLSQTLGLIVDERVRLFCVAAQVVDVEQKINSAITECMRLGTHAIRTAAVPLPLSGIIGTPTVSRLICEHVLQCFGFPKTTPAEIEKIMSDIVMGNLKSYLKVSLTQFAVIGTITLGAAIPTMGIGAVAGLAGSIWSLPPTARMLLKCSCDMILILERSFRYDGKYVSIKQIEDAARYYTTATKKTYYGKDKRRQQVVHDDIDTLIPLKKVAVAFKFNKLRNSVEDIIYNNRFDTTIDGRSLRTNSTFSDLNMSKSHVQLPGSSPVFELQGDVQEPPAELPVPDSEKALEVQGPAVELDSTEVTKTTTNTTGVGSPLESMTTGTMARTELSPNMDKETIFKMDTPELEGEAPVREKSRWGKISTWKIRGSKKSKFAERDV